MWIVMAIILCVILYYVASQIDGDKYQGMELDWNTDKTWKWVFEPKETDTEKIENESDNESDDETQQKITAKNAKF